MFSRRGASGSANAFQFHPHYTRYRPVCFLINYEYFHTVSAFYRSRMLSEPDVVLTSISVRPFP